MILRCAIPMLILLTCWCGTSRPQTPAADDALTLIDAAGKETLLKEWKFTNGTRPLTWRQNDPKAKDAHLYLEFREEKSTSFADGIATLVPLPAAKTLTYDHAKKIVRLTYLKADGKEDTLVGTTRFVNINRFGLEGTIGAGVVAAQGATRIEDGFVKAAIQGVRFPSPKPAAAPSGQKSTIVADDKERTRHVVQGLEPLYKVGPAYRMALTLAFQESSPIELNKISKLTRLPGKDKKFTALDFDVTTQAGDKKTLTLLKKTTLADKRGADTQAAVLVGLVGMVDAGYKLFPPHTIIELTSE